MRNIFLFFFCLMGSFQMFGQQNQRFEDSVQRRRAQDSLRVLTEADHKALMTMLKISSLRQGANGSNLSAPNAANYDESKANPYPVLPEPLKMKNGTKVLTAAQWWSSRRAEIMEDFDREVYGRTPGHLPTVKWKVISEEKSVDNNIPVIIKKLVGQVDNTSYPAVSVNIDLTLTTPANAKGPVPVVIEFGFVFPPGFRFPSPPADSSARKVAAPPGWQQQVLASGWGYAILLPVSIQADNGAGLRQGIIGLVNKGAARKPDDWGALKAWAWGASRAIDYFESDSSVDATKVAIEGHSRFGKAALVALAYEPRLATGFISSSGAGGAKLHRRNAGEIVENVAAASEYHWMAGNYLKYAGPLQWNDLPVDAHELIAMCAPRPVFISAGNKGDGWVDPRGMFMAAVGAGPVYTLLGKKPLGSTEFPALETGLVDGDIAFRQHSGGHTAGPNWPYFLTFAKRYFDRPAEGLKDYYSAYFPIGVAVSPRSLKTDEAPFIKTHFNSITPENAMKMGPIHPRENEYYWKDADSIAAFAKINGLKIRGHTLCWHSQAPKWFFVDSSGKTVTKEVLLQRLKDHITTVVNRYKGTIYAWDVVNEAISDNKEENFRNSEFYKICGEEFITKAFEYAHAADPDALLFYNDYNEIDAVKREKIYQLVSGLKKSGVPVHGVGLQGHWAINEPSAAQLDSTIRRFTDLGLTLQITELDISVYPKEHAARQSTKLDMDTGFSAGKEAKQIAVYKMCFEIFRKYRHVISGITFWNISDRHSWLDNFPVRGRKDYPLLFDKNLQPKKAFFEVVKF